MTKKIISKLNEGVETEVFPTAELFVSSKGKEIFHHCVGHFPNQDRYHFDLASLTKPLSTAILSMIFFQKKKLDLDATVSDFFSTGTIDSVKIRQLLNHTSGLRDWSPFYSQLLDQNPILVEENKEHILQSLLHDDNYCLAPGRFLYSDLGYMLLGFILENIGKDSLDHLFEKHIATKLKINKKAFFIPLNENCPVEKTECIPTEHCSLRKRIIQGEVMDKNCYILGGVTGHAGLFSDAKTVNKILLELRKASLGKSQLIQKETFELFCQPDPNRKWDKLFFTLGFETPTRGISQSGKLFSKNSIGHLGYSGTSFWWDLDRDFWVIFLSNRCMPNCKNFKIQKYRPKLYDVVVTGFFNKT